MRNAFSIALLLVIAALAVAACGGGGSGDGEKPTVPSGAVAVVGEALPRRVQGGGEVHLRLGDRAQRVIGRKPRGRCHEVWNRFQTS